MSGRYRRIALAVGAAGLLAAVAWAGAGLWQTSVPEGLVLPDVDPALHFDEDELAEADDYQALLRVTAILAVLAQLAALAFFATRGAGFARESAAGRIGTGMLLGMLALGVVWIAQLPFGLIDLWWQRRYDTTDLGYVDWVLSDFLSTGGSFMFIALALLIVMALAGIWRAYWWVAAVPALLGVTLLFALVQPYLLPGLERPRDPQVLRAVERAAAAQGVSDPSVWIQDTQDLTNAPNAGALGIGGSERVILWDNLVERFEADEVEVVVAHELAHLERDHIWKQFAWLALLAIPIAVVTQLATRPRGGLYEPTAIPLAVFVVTAMLATLTPLQTTFSQRLETEADWTAVESTRDPDAAIRLFERFGSTALAEPSSPGWADVLLNSHPSLIERIALAEAWRARPSGD